MITIKLVGGLGNQLFGYYFGQVVGEKVRYDVSDQSHGLGSQKVSIGDIALPGEFGVYFNRFSSIIPDRFKLIKLLLRKVSLLNQKVWRKSKIYESQVVGFDVNFDFENCGFTQIRGYFQSYLYVDAAMARKSTLKNLELTHSSNWFRILKNKLNEADPIVIHVRRGDYLRLKDTFGILGEEYYVRAIEKINSLSDTPSPVWIFSDSPNEIKESMPNLMKLGPSIISTPNDVSDAETLILMSLASRIVIANSTFSWWAARVNGSNKTVIAPEKWFRSSPDPEFLIPNNWIKLKSYWLD
jgi:hypothetical protein